MKKELQMAAERARAEGDMELNNAPSSEWASRFSTSEAAGRALYNSFSDKELLELLRVRTNELGHVPAQKEVFWAYRGYIRMRFNKWPYALKKAGLSTMAGSGGMTVENMHRREKRYEELMDLVRKKAAELGRPPHMFEMQDLQRELSGWFTTWAEVLDAAGVERHCHKAERLYRVKSFTHEEACLLQELRGLAERLGRAPLRGEVPEEVRRALNRRCGTWRNTLYQIGLEPVAKVSPFENTYLNKGKEQQRKPREILENSLYKLVDADAETADMLKELEALAKRLGRPPIKREVNPRVYSCLLKKCSTYRNMLYQIGMEPLNKAEAARIDAQWSKNKQNK